MKSPWRMLRGISSDLERLTLLTEELQTMRQSEQRLRNEMTDQRREAEEREAELNKKVKDLTKARNKARAERDKVTSQLERIQNSQSFKIGHAIVQVARFPMAALRGLRRGARKLLPSGREVPQLESAAAKKARSGGDAKPAKAPKPKKKPATPTLSIPSETPFLGPLMEGHSTTMFLVWGFNGDELANLVNDVARLQMMKRDFNPIFVTDADTWAPFQEHGYWFEYIPSAEEWMQHNPDTGWSEFVAERIDSIVATYAPDRIVVYEDTNKREALKRGVLNGVVGSRQIQIEEPPKAMLAPVLSTGKPVSENGGQAAADSAKKQSPSG
jgi:hypothetical protein